MLESEAFTAILIDMLYFFVLEVYLNIFLKYHKFLSEESKASAYNEKWVCIVLHVCIFYLIIFLTNSHCLLVNVHDYVVDFAIISTVFMLR
jgi:hypothetical protein